MSCKQPILKVTTSNGTYTVGMTRAEAEKNGSYKAPIGIDFKDLDLNKDGVLDEREVLVGKKNQAKREMYINGAQTAVMAAGTALAATSTAFSAGITSGLCALGARRQFLISI